MSNRTQYQRPMFSSLPVRKRPRQIWGADSLSNKRWKCWVCGFIANSDRDKVGDGVGYHSADIVDPGLLNLGTGDRKDVTLSIDNSSTIHLSRQRTEGDPTATVGNFTQQVSSGCPFCGSKNYR